MADGSGAPVRPGHRRTWAHVALWAAAVALLGEVRLVLNPGSGFRLTLGPVGLGFALVSFPYLPPVATAAAAGAAVVLLRTVLAALLAGLSPAAALQRHWPAGVYYLAQGMWLATLRARSHAAAGRPLLLAGSLWAADVLSNVLELALRHDALAWRPLALVALVGAGRAAVVAGLHLAVKAQEREWRHAQERAEYRRLLQFVTGLQAEIFFLRKSSAEMERIMVRAHSLYLRLKGDPDLAPLALSVAKDVHEVKKDYQRILAGLERLMKIRSLDPDMAVSDVVALAVESGRSYAGRLGKEIAFATEVRDDFRTPDYLVWVSVLNNLVANAVEAIEGQGRIAVTGGREGGWYVLRVQDTGSGIPPDDWELIFTPGYSTKSDPVTGEFSTGLGLAHAAGLVAALGGEIRVERSAPGDTVFRVALPLHPRHDGAPAGEALV